MVPRVTGIPTPDDGIPTPDGGAGTLGEDDGAQSGGAFAAHLREGDH